MGGVNDVLAYILGIFMPKLAENSFLFSFIGSLFYVKSNDTSELTKVEVKIKKKGKKVSKKI